MNEDTNLIISAAKKYWQLNLNAVPATQEKRPKGTWEHLHKKIISYEEFVQKLNGQPYGLGIICGTVSKNLEIIDIDHKYDITGNLVNEYFKLINEFDQFLFDSLHIVKSPTNGYHIYYRCEVIEGNQKLARRPTTEEEKEKHPKETAKVLIETRGQGGFIMCPPSPGYFAFQERPISTITPEERKFLLDAARSFDEMPEVSSIPMFPFTGESPWELSPWGEYDQNGEIISLLENHGWKIDKNGTSRIYLTRPGKDKGTSADYHTEKKLFKCWSTSVVEFEEGKAYSHTAVYAMLECGGNFSKACDQLEKQGYGKRKTVAERNHTKAYHNGDPTGPREPIPAIDYLKLFKSKIMDQDKEYPPPIPILSLQYNGETYPLLTLKSFSLWQGKQKSKKTVTLAIMIAAYISGTENIDQINFIGHGDGTVLWLDCEQGESYAARTMKLILKLAGVEKSHRLVYCDFRDSPPAERLKLIEAGISCTPDVQLVVVDGIVDLMNDFMEAAEGHGVITRLLAFCSMYNIHIAGVLHQNKADKNARAHVGSIGSQKCEIEISTEVDPDDKARSIVSCVNSRGIPFDKFAIRWDKGLLPCIDADFNGLTTKVDIKSQKAYEDQKEILKHVFKPLATLTHTQAQQAIMKVTEKGESTATRIIKNLKGWGLIEQGPDKLYRLVQSRVDDDDSI